MRFDIMTLFPEMVMNGLETSIIGRAVKNKILEIEAWNIRDYAFNKHSSVDDYPYGGGAGMLMQAEPVYQTYLAIREKATLPEGKRPRVIYLSPQGKPFNQKMAEDFAKEDELVLLCGHYEGIDERVLEEIVTDYVSAGDYVLTGGELPAMMIVDAVSRLIPGVLHNDVSAEFESFQDNLLEYQTGDLARQAGSTNPFIRSSCQCREMAQRAVSDPYCKMASGPSGRRRAYHERKRTCRRDYRKSRKRLEK